MSEPTRDRPEMPDGYGVPETDEGMLTWAEARARLEASDHFWLSTVSPNGSPHTVPLWGVWVDDRWYFDGSDETRHIRNLVANPAVSLNLEDGERAVIVRGTAQADQAPPRALAERVAAAYQAHYRARGYAPEPTQWDQGGLYVLTPRKALAWTSFPTDMTRFTFDQG